MSSQEYRALISLLGSAPAPLRASQVTIFSLVAKIRALPGLADKETIRNNHDGSFSISLMDQPLPPLEPAVEEHTPPPFDYSFMTAFGLLRVVHTDSALSPALLYQVDPQTGWEMNGFTLLSKKSYDLLQKLHDALGNPVREKDLGLEWLNSPEIQALRTDIDNALGKSRAGLSVVKNLPGGKYSLAMKAIPNNNEFYYNVPADFTAPCVTPVSAANDFMQKAARTAVRQNQTAIADLTAQGELKSLIPGMLYRVKDTGEIFVFAKIVEGDVLTPTTIMAKALNRKDGGTYSVSIEGAVGQSVEIVDPQSFYNSLKTSLEQTASEQSENWQYQKLPEVHSKYFDWVLSEYKNLHNFDPENLCALLLETTVRGRQAKGVFMNGTPYALYSFRGEIVQTLTDLLGAVTDAPLPAIKHYLECMFHSRTPENPQTLPWPFNDDVIKTNASLDDGVSIEGMTLPPRSKIASERLKTLQVTVRKPKRAAPKKIDTLKTQKAPKKSRFASIGDSHPDAVSMQEAGGFVKQALTRDFGLFQVANYSENATSTFVGLAQPFSLTPKEYQFLDLLYKTRGRWISRRTFYQYLFSEARNQNNAVNSAISSLRIKLTGAGYPGKELLTGALHEESTDIRWNRWETEAEANFKSQAASELKVAPEALSADQARANAPKTSAEICEEEKKFLNNEDPEILNIFNAAAKHLDAEAFELICKNYLRKKPLSRVWLITEAAAQGIRPHHIEQCIQNGCTKLALLPETELPENSQRRVESWIPKDLKAA